jgi:hypothetical protein
LESLSEEPLIRVRIAPSECAKLFTFISIQSAVHRHEAQSRVSAAQIRPCTINSHNLGITQLQS